MADLAGAVRLAPRVWLRLEGAVLMALALLAYAELNGGWGVFAAAFLLPDLALAAYLLGPRWGARAYNLTHSTLGPGALLVASWVLGAGAGLLAGLIWLAHIGFDRLLGYGLKYASGFGDTHLGRIGRAPALARDTIAP